MSPDAAGLIGRAAALLGDPTARADAPAVARALGATLDNRAEGTGFLGSDPVSGCYAVDVACRGDLVDSVVLRLDTPVPLADLVAGLGPYEKVTPVAGHRRLDAVEFRPPGVQLVARLDESRGAAIEVLIHPVP